MHKPRGQDSIEDGCRSYAPTELSAGGLIAILARGLKLLEGLGEPFSTDRIRLRELEERLTTERFHLAVLGQFKRGKSTLLNALIGEPLLPTSVVPLTSIPTFLLPGPKRHVRIRFLDGRIEEFADLSCDRAAEILANYVTEERNRKNNLRVAAAEVEHPSPLLHSGVVLIDTPGIGSTFRHNTDVTLKFLSQCDAALFVVSGDPPVTEVEVEFLNAVQTKVTRLLFVMNKADYLGDEERSPAVKFFKKVLREECGINGTEPIFTVSARQGLQGKLSGDRSLWERSGLQELQDHLLNFLVRDKSRTLRAALAKKARDTAVDATMRVRLQCRSLQLPLEDLEKRIGIFEETIKEVERERLAMGDLLSGERKRTVDFLEGQAKELRRRALRRFEAVAREVLNTADKADVVMQRLQDRLAEEGPLWFETELGSLSDATGHRIRETQQRFQDRADGLIEIISRTAAELFEIPYVATDSARAIERTHKPYWVTQNWSTSIGSLPEGLVDHLLPFAFRQRRLRKRLTEDIDTLVVRNVENIRWATLRNLDDAFRHFSSTLDERLKETAEATRGAMRAAYRRREENEATVHPEVRRLEASAAELLSIESALSKFADSKGN
jgi:GTPase SAR1 family protein